jgi:taurine dioxygenase
VLAELFDHMEQRRFIYEHEWRVGDLVMWDNLAVMHARTDFDPAEARILRRCTVAGERPLPAQAA